MVLVSYSGRPEIVPEFAPRCAVSVRYALVARRCRTQTGHGQREDVTSLPSSNQRMIQKSLGWADNLVNPVRKSVVMSWVISGPSGESLLRHRYLKLAIFRARRLQSPIAWQTQSQRAWQNHA
jgi:hypothetical protein